MDPAPPADAVHPPEQLGGYHIVETLSAGRTFRALAPGGRQVVLKLLDDDCLMRAQLHPGVRDRLARVKELAELKVANLHGVERDGGRVYCVWSWVPGVTLERYVAERPSEASLRPLLRELMLRVESLHRRGIVHGALHGRNIIVTDSGQPTLIDISPLLFHDPADDERALIDTLLAALLRRDGADDALRAMVEEAGASAQPLRRLRAVLVSGPTDPDSSGAGERAAERALRRRALLAAAAVAVVGAALATALAWYIRGATARQAAIAPPGAVLSHG